MRRCLPALAAFVAVFALLSSTAFAFVVQNAGFSATAYSSGYPLDTSGRGARASAWDGNVLWAVDRANGGVYRTDAGGPPGPGVALAASLIGTILGGPNGVAVGLDGRLYATLVDAQQVVELDKTDGHILRTLSTSIRLPAPQSLAADPLSGDLIVTSAPTSGGYVWRITQPATAPIPAIYSRVGSGVATSAVTIGPDGTIFVLNSFGQIFTIESTASAAAHAGWAAAAAIGSPIANMTGLGVVTDGVDSVPQYLMVSTSGGAVYKTPATSGASGNTILVLNGAGAGDQMSIGPDRCAYASMDGTIVRVADATGSCALNTAGVTPPSLTIADTTGQAEHAGGTASIGAHLTNATTLSGHDVTFQVVNSVAGTPTLTLTGTTDTSGNTSVSYTRAAAGTDTITATTSADGFAATSNTLTVRWLAQPDFNPPLISFSYTVPAGGQGTTFLCDETQTSASFPSGTSPDVPCGWFTKAPTIHFTVKATGTSGLGALSNCGVYTLDTQPPASGQPETCRAYNGDGLASATLTIVLNAVLTPPSVTATATANGAPYTAGSLTRGPVAVHFDCSASPIQTSLVCPADQSFSGTGLYDAAGTATDIAGQTTTVHFVPIDIDATPPTLSVSAGTYVFGTWTNADVQLTFTCADNRGIAQCPAPQTVTATTAGITVTATDVAGNTTQLTTGAIDIDKTPPTIIATATTADGAPYTPATPTNQNVTVHFTCATDGAPIVVCGPDVTIAAVGTHSASGTASDAAGNTATATFGVLIDRTPPTITAIVTVNGVPYDGTWTRGPVLVHFACADETQLASCPGDQVLTTDHSGTVSGTAVDLAGNSTATTTAPILIDRTPPVVVATLTGTAAGSATYLFTVNGAFAATDVGSGVTAIHYTVDGTPHDVAGATASFVVNTEGSHTVVFHATDAVGNVEADQTMTFTVIFRQHTTLTITSAPFLATGSLASARLMSVDAGAPVAGERVTFTIGAVTRTAVTDAAGIAQVDLGLAPGAYALAATYAGTPRYYPSADQQQLVAYALTRFVVWGPNAVVGRAVQFYGDDWAKQISDPRARHGFEDFKGYAETVLDASWSGRPGDAVKPPRAIPQYIGVIVTTHATKTKDLITGDRTGVAIVKVVPGGDDRHGDGATKPYDGRLGERAFGTVLAVVN